MLPLLLALAAAATPARPIPGHPLPYTLDSRQNGDILVTDAKGVAIPTPDVIRLAEGPDAAWRYQTHRSVRKATAVTMWVGGGVVFTASALGILGDQSGVAPLGLVAGVGLVGGGFGLLYGPPEERLDHWTNVARVSSTLPGLSGAGPDAPSTPALLAPNAQWFATDDGPTLRGYPVPVREVARTLGDEDTFEAYHHWRASRTRTLGGLIGGGAAVAVGGFIVGADARDPEIQRSATATGILGVGALAAGITAVAVPNDRKSASAWFTPEEIEEAVRLHNAGEAPASAGEPPPAHPPLLTVAPTIGLGYAGLHGTF